MSLVSGANPRVRRECVSWCGRLAVSNPPGGSILGNHDKARMPRMQMPRQRQIGNHVGADALSLDVLEVRSAV